MSATTALLRDAVGEGLRGVGWVAVAGPLLLVAAAPAVGGMALGARARATLDVALFLQWVVPIAVAVQLGAALPGARGLRAVVLAGPVTPGRWVALRWSAAMGLLAGLVGLMGLGGVALAPVRAAGAGVGVHLMSVWLEAAVWLGLTALARGVGARTWLAAVAAITVGAVGHLHAELLEAVSLWGLEPLLRPLLWMVPGMQRAHVQGLLIAGQPVQVATVGWAWAHLLGWSLATAGATVVAMSRRGVA